MKVKYDEKVDILYIKLKECPYHESDEIKEGIVLDYDKKGKVIGLVEKWAATDEQMKIREKYLGSMQQYIKCSNEKTRIGMIKKVVSFLYFTKPMAKPKIKNKFKTIG